MNVTYSDLRMIRNAVSEFSPASRVEPNEQVFADRVFTSESHRSVLDVSRQLVVGNRGMGKSLSTHAMLDTNVRLQVAKVYGQPALEHAQVVIGYNGSDRASQVAPTRDGISRALDSGCTPDQLWRAVIFRAVSYA